MKRSLIRMLTFVFALILCLSVALTALADYKTIAYGSTGNDVRKMQSALKTKGFYKGTVDGVFGDSTRKAVISFQNSVGIRADGKPGNKTLTALYEGKSAINQTADTELKQQTKPSNPNTLYYGCKGDRVKSLQRALRAAGVYKGSIDGVYGDLTLAAVKAYQSKKGLHVDGMAGTKTLNSLNQTTDKHVSTSFTLDIGSRGAEVLSVARRMKRMGYLAEVTSVYNEELASAVKKWQKATGRTVTGAVTQSQYNKLILDD